MNNSMFPVHLNSSRRLRRGSIAPIYPFVEQVSSLPDSDRSAATHDQDKSAGSANLLNPDDQEMFLRQQAIDQAQQGRYPEAIAMFTQLIAHNPQNASNHNNRGLLYFQAGQFERALADYDRALWLNPRLAKVYNNRANCYAALGELEAAIADYESAIDFDPTDIRAHINQGITFRQLHLFSLAINSFDLALQFSQFLNSTDTVGVSSALEGHLYAERGRTYHYLGDWNYAIADYHRALARLPLSEPSSSVSARLRVQVRSWLDDLLTPLRTE